MKKSTVILTTVLAALLGLFGYATFRRGPLSPVSVTVAKVDSRALKPGLFGVGTVEARYRFRIGPTSAGRLRSLNVNVGDLVSQGQVLGEMDPVDLDERIAAQSAALLRAEANVLAARAQETEAESRKEYTETQARRYEELLASAAISIETFEAKKQESAIAAANLLAVRANLDAASREQGRFRADREGLSRQRANLLLKAPMDAMVIQRLMDPGTTVAAGEAVVELIDPKSPWLNVRFDQSGSSGLKSGLPVSIELRSGKGKPLPGRIFRIEPLADAVTEEILAKVIFDSLPDPLPPVGELVEVMVDLPETPTWPVVLNASLQSPDGTLGVWVVEGTALRFAPVTLGARDLNGFVQILSGVKPGETTVVHSHRSLHAGSRIKIVEKIPGAAP